jgi:hypothetical protein
MAAEHIAEVRSMRTNRQIDYAEELRRLSLLNNERERAFASVPCGAPTVNDRLDGGHRLVRQKAHPTDGGGISGVSVEDRRRVVVARQSKR